MSDLVHHARLFATAAHGAVGQVRKYSGEPYITHPARVAQTIEDYLIGDIQHEYAVAAAWLHDVVEDTKVPIETIYAEFGRLVGDMVRDLTNVPLSAGNRKTRFALNLEKLSKSSPQAASIKLADIIDNLSSIVEHDPEFALVYLREKDKAVTVLTHGDERLVRRAIQVIEDGDRRLSP